MRLYNTRTKLKKKSTVFLYTVWCCAQSLQSCPTLRPMDCSLPGSSVHGDSVISKPDNNIKTNQPKNHYTPENRLKDPQQSTVNSIQQNTWSITHHDPPGSSVHGDSLGKNTGVNCCPSSGGSSRPKDWTLISSISCTAGRLFTHKEEAHISIY